MGTDRTLRSPTKVVWIRLSHPPMRQVLEELIYAVSLLVFPITERGSRGFPTIRIGYANRPCILWEDEPLPAPVITEF